MGAPEKKVKRAKPLLEPSAESHDGNSKFARALGSTDYMTREKGLQALTRWLQLKTDLSELDMMKIWKGLYFCFWHSDKTPVQVRLCGICWFKWLDMLSQVPKKSGQNDMTLMPPCRPSLLSVWLVFFQSCQTRYVTVARAFACSALAAHVMLWIINQHVWVVMATNVMHLQFITA